MNRTCYLALLVVAGCVGSEAIEPETAVEDRVVAQFEARIDPVEGTITFETFGTTAKGVVPLNVVQNGIPNNGPVDSLELITSNTGNGAGFCGAAYPNSFCGDITVRSFYGVELENAYAVVTSIIPATGHEGKNSDPATMGMSDVLGLWRYGTIASGGALTRTWIFGDTGMAYTVRGEVRGDIPGTTPVSCNTILTMYPGTPDGVYTIDPDGLSGVNPTAVYCDMTTDGGGWQKILQYPGSPGWTPTASAVGDITTASVPAPAKLSDAVINAISGPNKTYRFQGNQTNLIFYLRSSYAFNDRSRSMGLVPGGGTSVSVCENVNLASCTFTNTTHGTIDTLHMGLVNNDCNRYFTDYSSAIHCYNPTSYSVRCMSSGNGCAGHAIIGNFSIWLREI